MIKPAAFIVGLMLTIQTTAQTSCDELMQIVKRECGFPSTVYTSGSEWLVKVEFYSYEMKYFAVAHIKDNQWSYSARQYIFCGIPFSNKSAFSGNYKGSWGESFHEYIMDYQCNCQ